MACPLGVVLALLLLWLPISAALAAATVDIVLSGRSAPYLRVAEQITQYLDPRRFPRSSLRTVIVDEWQPHSEYGAGWIVSVGTRAARRLMALDTPANKLSIMLSSQAYRLLRQGQAGRPGKSMAIVLDQPAHRYVHLIRQLLPMARRVGVLHGESSSYWLTPLRRAGEAHALAFEAIALEPGDNAAKAIKRLIQLSDVILALPDPVALTPQNAKWLLYMAYQRSVPVIGYSKALAKAGALASLYSSPEQIGREAAELINRHGNYGVGDAIKPHYFSVTINRWVAKSLHIDAPREEFIMQRLQQLEQQEHGAH